MRKIALSSIAAIAIATPGIAAAPPFETPAPVAVITVRSWGAAHFAKDADRRMPPA